MLRIGTRVIKRYADTLTFRLLYRLLFDFFSLEEPSTLLKYRKVWLRMACLEPLTSHIFHQATVIRAIFYRTNADCVIWWKVRGPIKTFGAQADLTCTPLLPVGQQTRL